MAQPKERRECKVCGKRFTVSTKLRLFCSVRCRKGAKRAQSRQWNRENKEKIVAYTPRAKATNFTMNDIQFFPIPDSKGQADFHSGLMV